jgi:hypothetical protein
MKKFFSVFTRVLTASLLCSLAVATRSTAGEITLEDDSTVVAFDTDSGALTRLENKTTHWTVQKRPELGMSFRMHIPLADRSGNSVNGENQHPVSVQKIAGNQVRLEWKDLSSDHGGVLPVTFTATVTLKDGALTFDSTVTNDSPLMVESVDYPCLGDLTPPAPSTPMWSEHMWYANLVHGDLFPSGSVLSKQSLFCLLQSPEQGLYVEMHDPTQPYLLEFASERRRGLPKSAGNATLFRLTHTAYVHPHTSARLAPVVMHFYQGDWHAGVDLYKTWRKTWFQEPHIPAWALDVNSWQQLQINTPEQDYRVPFTNLLQYGEECADNGVGAIQLVGWNYEGQDGGDPVQNPDPGLGTWQELHDAIAQIQARGVKIILFAKLNWADRTTEWEQKELYKYACTDPDGKRYEQGGYSYFTPTQLAGLNTHHRDIMDFNDPTYQDIATKEFQKILALGSAGWLWDEVCHHASVEYSYAPDHGYTAPGYIYGGDMPLARKLWAAADQVNPYFLFSGEGPEDWLMQYFPCSYFRINATSRAVCRYIDSQAPLMVAVTGYDDREMLNLILMQRYIISYEPYNFKGHLEDYPLTLEYGKKIDALRRKYKSYLWDAEFRDTLGATVTANGDSKYSVFATPAGKRAVVVINMEFSKAINAKVHLPNPGTLMAASPESPDAQPTTGDLQIPARSAVVVMEQ